MRFNRSVLVVLALSAASVMLANSANAATISDSPPAAQTSSYESAANFKVSPELQAYLNSLTPAQRQTFTNTMIPTTTVKTVTVTAANSTAKLSLQNANAQGKSLSTNATGCWTARTQWEQKNIYGGGIYMWYHVGSWCASGSTVTSSGIADWGGQTYAIGWRYEGRINGSSGIVSNQGRSYTQQKFVLGVGGWDVDTRQECARIIGNASGSASGSMTCGIY